LLEIIDGIKGEMDDSIHYLKDEYKKLKAGKANPAMLENMLVEYYGTKTPLQQLATINVPEPRIFVIQPYDKNSIKSIESSINNSDLGVNATIDNEVLRIILPEITEERRIELVKIINQKAEEARIAIRNIREKVWKEVKDLESSGELTEDEKYKAQDYLDSVVNEYNNNIKETEENKEKELMKV
jgi:ribosome recycling factor